MSPLSLNHGLNEAGAITPLGSTSKPYGMAHRRTNIGIYIEDRCIRAKDFYFLALLCENDGEEKDV